MMLDFPYNEFMSMFVSWLLTAGHVWPKGISHSSQEHDWISQNTPWFLSAWEPGRHPDQCYVGVGGIP